ncbi:MAG: aldehyde dehydrogenase family protein [Alphaproteobacteria bacterium]
MKINSLLQELGVDLKKHSGRDIVVTTPIDGSRLAALKADGLKAVDEKIEKSVKAFKVWRDIPAPKRGELIRLYGEELRKNKDALAQLVTIECGKVTAEGLGEVQEMIDICDFAVGLSRQLYGLTIASERSQHVMQETWQPLGPVAVISAFNFPVAVWAWNFALAVTCGDSVLWKPSEKTPLSALACQALFLKAVARFTKAGGQVPQGLSQIILGEVAVGERLVSHPAVSLVSATGSTRMGRKVGPRVAERFGKSLLELGGNNAIIVSDKADLNLALTSILFGAVGTAGQRCTTTRRVIAHKSIYNKLVAQLEKNYAAIAAKKIGNPLDKNTLVGPLIDEASYQQMQKSLRAAQAQGGKVQGGKRVLKDKYADGFYVEPALVKMKKQTDVVMHETFAPILYVIPYTTLAQALDIHNAVPQGLSSSIFTTDVREAEFFRKNSDCGIANVNIGTSGAEIGGAFGGEKETGGGRESGSDSWKNYMRRQTSTLYYGTDKPALAQGIIFNV